MFQINDTHLHRPLKAKYREKETTLMLEKLSQEPGRIPCPSRDEIMQLTVDSLNEINIDYQLAFKNLGLTNALDGHEDYLMSDRLFELVGPSIIAFREKLLEEELPASFEDLLKTITPPKGKSYAMTKCIFL